MTGKVTEHRPAGGEGGFGSFFCRKIFAVMADCFKTDTVKVLFYIYAARLPCGDEVEQSSKDGEDQHKKQPCDLKPRA